MENEQIIETREEPPKKTTAEFLKEIPRRISFALEVTHLFGFKTAKTGWSILSISLIMLFSALFFTDYKSVIFTIVAPNTTKAEILSANKSIWSQNNKPLYKYVYIFENEQGQKFNGVSYAHIPPNPDVDLYINVQYLNFNPKISSAAGMASGVFPLNTLIIMLFTSLLGLLLISIGYEKGKSINNILKYGHLLWAELKEKIETKLKIKDKTVYKLVFEYEDIDKKLRTLTFKTHRIDELSPEGKEPVFYDALKHQKAVMYLSLKSRVFISEDNIFTVTEPNRKLLNILFPFSSFAVFTAGIILTFKYLL